MELKKLVRSWQIAGTSIFANLFTGLTAAASIRDVLTTLTYSASMAINAALGDAFIVSPTDNVAFAFQVPTNPPTAGQSELLSITIRNATGGALGAATFTAGAGGFRIGAAWTQPANGFSRTIWFRWTGSVWAEVSRTAADVAN